MSRICPSVVRALGYLSLFASVVALTGWSTFGGLTPLARGADVVRVEEDWELVLGQPDPATNAPQITCVFSPIGDVNTAYAAFDINHHSQPNYSAGGLQLQVWSNNVPLISNNDPDGQVLSQGGERVAWTQKMELANGVLTVAITNGSSQAWGSFGGDGRLQASVGTSLTNLNSYSPTVSVANSGIGFSANRVQSLRLLRVRYYTAEGQKVEDDTVRVVYDHE